MHSRTLLGLPLMLTLAAAACGGSTPAPEPQGQEQPKPAAAVDPATAATIKGKVTFDGTAPANAPIKMNADPYCVTANKTPQTQETYMVGKGGELGNVFVYISDGLGDRTFQAPTDPVVIDQQNCRYHPHVLGLMVGQPLQILNSDGTLHNIHAIPTKNAEFNTGQPIKGMKTDHIFTAAETMVPFKCDVHGWMNAYAGVLPHPYLRRHRRGRHVHHQEPAARHVQADGVAREARHADGRHHGCREGREGKQLHVQSRRSFGKLVRRVEGQRGKGSGALPRPLALIPICSALHVAPPLRQTRFRLHSSPDCCRRSRHQHRLRPVRS